MTRHIIFKNFFGTDGIRGKVGTLPIRIDWVLKLGWSIGLALKGNNKHKEYRVAIGKDTRRSCCMIELALKSGLISAGINPYSLGLISTPGVGYITKLLGFNLGIMITASHNSYRDNGIKIISSNGEKISHLMELKIENKLFKKIKINYPYSTGRSTVIIDSLQEYIKCYRSALVKFYKNFNKLKIIIDSSNGSSHTIAPNIFQSIKVDIIQMSNLPDGLNINKDCGSTNTKNLSKYVIYKSADLGIALDGDGDRVIMIDHKGEIVSGDEILFILSKWFKEARVFLKNEGVVGTIMSNIGLQESLSKIKVPFIRADVGDKNILSELKKRKWSLGGEPSGHIIDLNSNIYGDGVYSALQVLKVMIFKGKSLHALKNEMKKYPQIHHSIQLKGKYKNISNILKNRKILHIVNLSNYYLRKDNGRIIIRKSGTENIIRLMVEGKIKKNIQMIAGKIIKTISIIIND